MEFLLELLKEILAPGMVLAGLAWLIQILFRRGIDRGTAKFKSELEDNSEVFRNELDRSMALLRHEFEMQRTEHQARFTLLHEKRAIVFEEFYSLLVETSKNFGYMTATMKFGDGRSIRQQKDD